MIDGVTLNQLRAFVAVCDNESFSKASRKLDRAQSAISHAIAALEETLNLRLFERDGKKPDLTAAGRALLADARAVIERTEELKTRARSIQSADPHELSLAVDPFFPRQVLAFGLQTVRERSPGIRVKLFTPGMTGGEALLLQERCVLALFSADTPPLDGARIQRQHVCECRFVTVCAPQHPLASVVSPVPTSEFERYDQLVVTEHNETIGVSRRGVAGERHWLVGDLDTKHDLLRAGLGWGHMPEVRVAQDVTAGSLVRLVSQTSTKAGKLVTFVIASLRGRELTTIETLFLDALLVAAEKMTEK